ADIDDINFGLQLLFELSGCKPVIGALCRRNTYGEREIHSLWRPRSTALDDNGLAHQYEEQGLDSLLERYLLTVEMQSGTSGSLLLNHTPPVFACYAIPRSSSYIAGILVYDSDEEQVLLEIIASAFAGSVSRLKSLCDEGCALLLTERESEILTWASQGKSAPEMAMLVGITERTVRFHLKNIYQKLNVSNRAHAIAEAVKIGIL
ncbi:MAG: LuxR C-terminal-related transcriptional regulator, partial [Candidatus Thiodiazotropha sp.]